MRLLSRYAIVVYALVFIMSHILSAQINPNGGFETGTPGIHTGTEVSGWNFQLGGTAAATFRITAEADSVHTGSQALLVTVTAIGGNAWEPQVFNTDFPVTANTTYAVSAWAKVDIEGAKANFTMGSLSPNYHEWGRQGNVELGYEWQQISFQVTTRDPETEPRGGIPIHFGLTDNQTYLPITFFLDDVEVTVVGGSEVAEDEAALLHKYSLAQNYPNPFNPLTTIGFSLPVSGNVRLVLSDMLGRTVQEIAAGRYDAGTHQVTLNLSNLSSGIYFYTLEAGTFMSTKKLVLMK
jgi:hypothetical protein